MSKASLATLSDASPQYLDYLRRERWTRITVRGSQIGILVVFTLLWEALPRLHIVNPLFTSYPSAIWPTFIELLRESQQQASILTHAWSSVFATVVGFSLATVLGVALAAVLWRSDTLYKILDPYFVVANAMPKTAFVPIFYLWLGATLSVYGMSLAISLFITTMIIYTGYQGIDPNKIKLALTFGATRGQIFRKVVFPGSVPSLFAALKVNVGLSLTGVVVGEFQSANLGLGYLIQYGSQIFKLNIVMTAITILALISVALYVVIYFVEALVTRGR